MTLAKPPKKRYSITEYLEFEKSSQEKHEYRDGEILLMSGGTPNHSLICLNVMGELRNRLKGSRCRAYESNLRVRIPRSGFYAYPDGSVICDPAENDPDDPSGESFTNPRLIVEVLSPSTEAYDRGEKFLRYLMLDSLQEYVLVSQSAPRIETFFRQPDGAWNFNNYSGLAAAAQLRSLQIELPLAEAFAGITFPPPESPV